MNSDGIALWSVDTSPKYNYWRQICQRLMNTQLQATFRKYINEKRPGIIARTTNGSTILYNCDGISYSYGWKNGLGRGAGQNPLG